MKKAVGRVFALPGTVQHPARWNTAWHPDSVRLYALDCEAKQCTLRGGATGGEALAELMARLQDVPGVVDVELVFVSRDNAPTPDAAPPDTTPPPKTNPTPSQDAGAQAAADAAPEDPASTHPTLYMVRLTIPHQAGRWRLITLAARRAALGAPDLFDVMPTLTERDPSPERLGWELIAILGSKGDTKAWMRDQDGLAHTVVAGDTLPPPTCRDPGGCRKRAKLEVRAVSADGVELFEAPEARNPRRYLLSTRRP